MFSRLSYVTIPLLAILYTVLYIYIYICIDVDIYYSDDRKNDLSPSRDRISEESYDHSGGGGGGGVFTCIYTHTRARARAFLLLSGS